MDEKDKNEDAKDKPRATIWQSQSAPHSAAFSDDRLMGEVVDCRASTGSVELNVALTKKVVFPLSYKPVTSNRAQERFQNLYPI